MKISKNKKLSAVLALFLAISTFSSHAFSPIQFIKNIFSSCKKLTTPKKVAIGTAVTVGVVAALIWAISGIKKCSDDRKKRQAQRRIDNAFFQACSDGDLEEVKRLYKLGANLLYRATVRDTPILKATENGHLDIVKFLIEHGVDVNGVYVSGDGLFISPLSKAISSKKVEIMKYLVENGANINDDMYFYIFLLWVINHSEEPLLLYLYSIVKYLLENGLAQECIKGGPPQGVRPDFIEDKYKTLYKNCASGSITQELYSTTSTKDLLDHMNDDDCPCCLKQKAIAELFARAKDKNVPYVLTLEKAKQFFKKVPFNERFLEDLGNAKAIPFIVEHGIRDKFNRDILTACIQCCKDDELIEKIVSNYFVRFGALDCIDISSAALKNWLVPTEEKGDFESSLKRIKRRNKKVYKHLLNRFYVVSCGVEKIPVPGYTVGSKGEAEYIPQEVAYYIVSFMGNASAENIVCER